MNFTSYRDMMALFHNLPSALDTSTTLHDVRVARGLPSLSTRDHIVIMTLACAVLLLNAVNMICSIRYVKPIFDIVVHAQIPLAGERLERRIEFAHRFSRCSCRRPIHVLG
jgi:hypothetical protein